MKNIDDILREKLPTLPVLSFSHCTLSRKTKMAHFLFFCTEDVSEQVLKKMADTIQSEAGLSFECVVEVTRPLQNPHAVRATLLEYLKKEFFPIFCVLSEENVEVELSGGKIRIRLALTEALKGMAESKGLKEKTTEYLGGQFLMPVEVALVVQKEKSRQDELKEYLSREHDYKYIRAEKVDYFVQENLFFSASAVPERLRGSTFVVFDFETTGFDAVMDKVVEIGAVKIENGVIVEKFSSLINPNMAIPKAVIKVHGITDDMVRYSPKMSEALPDFLRFIGEARLVAHNAEFDAKFLRVAAQEMGITVNFELLDTLQLAREVLPRLKNHKLGTLSEHFKTTAQPDHRALSDATATAEIFIELEKLREFAQKDKKEKKII